MTRVVLLARSIGRRSWSEPLSAEGHAGLAVGEGGASWIVQGGPAAGLLRGAVTAVADPREAFAVAAGAVWDTGESLVLPITELATTWARAADGVRLAAIVDELNERRLLYRYEDGPNSNTFVRMVLERLGCPCRLPAEGPVLRGWDWTSAVG
jgi:hypothetical protein